ncbi:acylase [Nibrella saemangeumensis]|uniref:Acylase n=1 Tax=Nibrella saemangeumensis TaxID=1084526 RepID=A0ABP8NGL2_9BACT
MKTRLPVCWKKLVFPAAFLVMTFGTAQAQQPTEIIWDKYGVPHIYGRTTNDMYYAYGWSQMHNHANLILKLYGQARGRAAEYWGETYLPSDQQIHLFNLPEVARQQYARQDADSKTIVESFVKGINAYAQAHPEAIDATMKQVLPVTPYDVLAHSTRVICLEFLARQDIATATHLLTPGSNSYAIAPSRSASKKAMLVTNPHLPWGDFFLFFEAHLTAPGFNAYGVSLVGQPVLNIAFNDNLGWTHTVNTIDASDRYELTLQDGGYLLDGAVQLLEKKTVSLKIRQADGSMKTRDLALAYSKHGPVIGEKNGKAYAIRVAGLANASMASQYHKMAQAKDLKAFEDALKMMQNPMFNVIYADKAGNILYLFNGNVPVRSEGNWAFWNNTVDGRSSKYIWNQYHQYEDLPRVLNPPAGFVQNANDAPWTSTYPMVLKPSDYPPYMAPQVMTLRPQRAVNLIKDDASITFDELIGYKLNTGMEAADRFLDDLLAAVNQYPDPAAQRAAAVLQKWDKATNTDSRGAVLFASWFDKLEPGMLRIPWNPAQPVTTPDGLKDPQQAVALLVKAAADVQQLYGALDVAWGEVNRFLVGSHNVPANGGSERYGIFRTMYFSPNKQDQKNYAVAGDTYVAVTEFGDTVHAQVLLSYGNATQPGSKHIGDQLPLLSQKKLRPALLDRNQILQNMEKRETLSPSN